MARAFDWLALPQLLLVLAALLATVLSACAEEPVTLRLSWLLGDNRSCAEAGVIAVEVAVTSARRASSRFSCEEGFAPHLVDLGAFEPGVVRIEVEAFSADDALLYRAEGMTDLHEEQGVARMQLDPVPR